MDVEYKLGESMLVRLNSEDIASLESRGYATARQGIIWGESKTWVRTEPSIDAPRVIIDGGPDVNIDLPRGQQLPLVIGREAISAYNDDQSYVDWYFPDGTSITVECA
jgi:hypothetical protein